MVLLQAPWVASFRRQTWFESKTRREQATDTAFQVTVLPMLQQPQLPMVVDLPLRDQLQ